MRTCIYGCYALGMTCSLNIVFISGRKFSHAQVRERPLFSDYSFCRASKRIRMAEIYTTCCSLCKKQFKTRKALEKHYNQKHPGHDILQDMVFSSATKQAPILRPRPVKKRNLYLEWLAEVVECINSAHNPRVPGKYLNTNGRIEIPKFSFLKFLLLSLTANFASR